MRQVSKKRKTRVGKLGIVRLVGEDMTELRQLVFERDGGECQVRDKEGKRLPGCWIRTTFEEGELVHRRTKRNNGDTPENTMWGCSPCHEKSHNSFGKPCPSKAVMA